jgi:hypothetical protein
MFNVYYYDESFKEPDDQIYYLIAENGVFQVKKTTFFTSATQIFEPKKGKNLGWLKTFKGSLRIHLPKKIPFELVRKTIGFFREVHEKFEGSEAIVLLYWLTEEKRYELVIPEQKVGNMALPHYEIGKNPEGMIKVGDIHSHGSGSAFHSGVDDTDEQHDDGIHITIGNVDLAASLSCSIVCDGERNKVKTERLIQGVEAEAFPADWMKKVKKAAAPVYKNPVGGYQAPYRRGSIGQFTSLGASEPLEGATTLPGV